MNVLISQQMNHYEEVYAEVSRLEDWQVFDGWFRVDIRSFKMSLLNNQKMELDV